MKKYFISFLLFCTVFAGSAASYGVSAATQSNANIKIDGVSAPLAVPVYNIGGRTMFPFREVFQLMDAAVSWEANTKTAAGVLGTNKVEFTVGSNTYKVNGATKNMDPGVTAVVISGKTYIPIRYAAESLGYSVDWDAKTSTVALDKSGSSPSAPSTASAPAQKLTVEQAEKALEDFLAVHFPVSHTIYYTPEENQTMDGVELYCFFTDFETGGTGMKRRLLVHPYTKQIYDDFLTPIYDESGI